MRNSKLIALLSAGAMVISSVSGLSLSSGSALAATARARYDHTFFSAISNGLNTANAANTDNPWGANPANWTYSGLEIYKSDYRTILGPEFSGIEVNKATNQPAIDLTGDGNNDSVAQQGLDNLTSGASINEIYMIWPNNSDNIAQFHMDGGNEPEILMNSKIKGNVAVGSKQVFVGLSKDSTKAPDGEMALLTGGATWVKTVTGNGVYKDFYTLEGVSVGNAAANDDYIASGVVRTTDLMDIYLDPTAEAAHYTQKTMYIFAGDAFDDDDGQYITLHVAYPDAVVVGSDTLRQITGASRDIWNGYNSLYNITSDNLANVQANNGANNGDAQANNRLITWGSDGTTFYVNKTLKNALPKDEWVWKLGNTTDFEFKDARSDGSFRGTQATVKTTAGAQKGATTTLSLYTNVADDDHLIFTYTIGCTSPNFYDTLYIRESSDVNGNNYGTDYANGTYYAGDKTQVELMASVEALENNDIANINARNTTFVWTELSDPDSKVEFLAAGDRGNFANVTGKVVTFRYSGTGEYTAKYRVRAFSSFSAAANFDPTNAGTITDAYSERTVTIVFGAEDPNGAAAIGPKVGTAFTVDDAYYEVLADNTVKFVKYVGTNKSYTVPSTVEYDGFTLTVVAIGKKAFASKTQLVDVTVPETVTELGNGAFKNCKKLTSVTFLGNIANTPKNVFLKAGAKGGKKLKVSVGGGTSDETIKALKRSNKNAKIK